MDSEIKQMCQHKITTVMLSFAIKTGAVRDFLDNSVISYQTADTGVELKTAQIVSAARAYTMLISCTAQEDDSGKK